MDVSTTTPPREPIYRELSCGICGYLRTGLSPAAKCPECGAPPSRNVTPLIHSAGAAVDQSERAWLFSITVGLLLLMFCSYFALQSELFINNGGLTLIYINSPGPKLTAGGCLLREMGNPAEWGVQGVLATLGTLLAVWLITEPRAQRGDEKWLSLRRVTRITAVLAFGALFGALLSGYEADVQFWGWYGLPSLVAAVGLVELPCNTLLYCYLAKLSRRFDPSDDPRPQTAIVVAAWLIAASCAGGVILSMLRAAAEDKPVELWRGLQAAYGVLSLSSGLLMTLGVLRLTARTAVATIDQSAASLAHLLPGLLAPLRSLLDRVYASPQRFAAAAGLLLWMNSARPLLAITETFNHRTGVGGDLPSINFIGPKVWAVPLMEIEEWNRVDTRLAILGVLAALWLITLYRPTPKRVPPAWLVRWLPTLIMGAAFGFSITIAKVADRFRQSHWNAGVIVFIEAPMTMLAYQYLARLAGAIDQPKLASQFRWLSVAAGALIVWPTGYLVMARVLRPLHDRPIVLALGMLYGTVMMAVGLMVWASFVRLTWLLIAPAVQRSAEANCEAVSAAWNSGVGIE